MKIEELKEKQRELELLEKQYLEETPPCCTSECAWYVPRAANGCCSWSVLLEDCKEYTKK